MSTPTCCIPRVVRALELTLLLVVIGLPIVCASEATAGGQIAPLHQQQQQQQSVDSGCAYDPVQCVWSKFQEVVKRSISGSVEAVVDKRTEQEIDRDEASDLLSLCRSLGHPGFCIKLEFALNKTDLYRQQRDEAKNSSGLILNTMKQGFDTTHFKLDEMHSSNVRGHRTTHVGIGNLMTLSEKMEQMISPFQTTLTWSVCLVIWVLLSWASWAKGNPSSPLAQVISSWWGRIGTAVVAWSLIHHAIPLLVAKLFGGANPDQAISSYSVGMIPLLWSYLPSGSAMRIAAAEFGASICVRCRRMSSTDQSETVPTTSSPMSPTRQPTPTLTTPDNSNTRIPKTIEKPDETTSRVPTTVLAHADEVDMDESAEGMVRTENPPHTAASSPLLVSLKSMSKKPPGRRHSTRKHTRELAPEPPGGYAPSPFMQDYP